MFKPDIINILKKNKKILLIICSFFVLFAIFTATYAMQYYQTVDFSTGMITTTELNVREGPRNKF